MSYTPKFLMAENACFMSERDLEVFVAEVEKQLEKDRPVGSSYVVYKTKGFVDGDRGGQVSIERSDVPDMTMARFSYKRYLSILRWVPGRDRFINIAYRLED